MKKYLKPFLFVAAIFAFVIGSLTAGPLMLASIVVAPFGAIDSQAPAYAATLAATISNQSTQLKVSVTGNMTINLTLSSELRTGAVLFLEIISDASIRTITMGTGMLGANLVTVASKTHTQTFRFDGTNFIADGASVQVN